MSIQFDRSYEESIEQWVSMPPPPTPALSATDHYLVNAVRKFGAQLFVAREGVINDLNCGQLPPALNLENLFSDLVHLRSEYVGHVTEDHFTPEQALITKIFKISTEWFDKVHGNAWASAADALPECEAFFQRVISLYSQLNQRTALANHPSAKDLGLVLLDFETWLVGLPDQMLAKVAGLHNNLLVNRDLHVPQEGFFREVPVNVVRGYAQLRQSKLLTVLRDEKLEGFVLPTYNQDATEEILGDNYEMLCKQSIIRKDDRIGWVHFVASDSKTRLEMARNQLNIYNLVDQALLDDSTREGVNLLFASVREGEYANISMKAHQRHGWEKTDCTYLGMDGVTPYRIIFRRSSENPPPSKRLSIGLSSHFDAYKSAPFLTNKNVDTAQCISNQEAVDKVKSHFDRFYHVEVTAMAGQCFYILIRDGGRQVNLHQIGAGMDLWLQFGKDKVGSLDRLFPHIEAELGYRREIDERPMYDEMDLLPRPDIRLMAKWLMQV